MRAPKLFVLVALFISLLALTVWTGMRLAPESAPVPRGAAYAQTRGCISCHGDPANPIADALVEEPLTGRIAQFFFNRQAVYMPRYNSLRAEEVDTLVNYVLALQDIGPMTAQDIREYGLQTQAYRNLISQQEKRQ